MFNRLFNVLDKINYNDKPEIKIEPDFRTEEKCDITPSFEEVVNDVPSSHDNGICNVVYDRDKIETLVAQLNTAFEVVITTANPSVYFENCQKIIHLCNKKQECDSINSHIKYSPIEVITKFTNEKEQLTKEFIDRFCSQLKTNLSQSQSNIQKLKNAWNYFSQIEPFFGDISIDNKLYCTNTIESILDEFSYTIINDLRKQLKASSAHVLKFEKEVNKAHSELSHYRSEESDLHSITERVLESRKELFDLFAHIERKKTQLSETENKLSALENEHEIIIKEKQKAYESIVDEYGKHYDDMDGFEFEQFCVNLLSKNEYTGTSITAGSGDYGVDILTEKDGVKYALQCKCYSSNIGIKAVQEVYSGKDYYKRHIGIVLTNQYFTKAAKEKAERLGVVLWDRAQIERMRL